MEYNIVVVNEHYNRNTVDQYFNDFDTIYYMLPDTDILDCFVKLGIYKTKEKARKKWKHPIEYEPGYHEYIIYDDLICILNPR